MLAWRFNQEWPLICADTVGAELSDKQESSAELSAELSAAP